MSGPLQQKDEKVQVLTQRINELVEQAEQLGCEGKVEEAQGVLKLCEQLREERDAMSTVSPNQPFTTLFCQHGSAHAVANVAGVQLPPNSAAEGDGGVRDLRRLPGHGRCAAAGGGAPDWQAAHGLRQGSHDH